MYILWLLLFCNAAGTWSSWIVFGPYLVTTQLDTLTAFGIVAFARQLCGFAGTLLAETWPYKGRTETANRLIEIALIFVNVIALACVWLLPDSSTFVWVAVWSIARYLLGGANTVFGFRLILDYSNYKKSELVSTLASSSVIGQLAVGQGSVVLGAFLALAFSQFDQRTAITLALGFDILTSFIFFLWLMKLRLPKPTAHKEESFLLRLLRSFRVLFNSLPRRNSFAFLLSLIALSSLPTIFLYFSRLGVGSELTKYYSTMNLINGGFLLLTAYLMNISKLNFDVKKLFFIGLLISILGCAFALIINLQGPQVFIVSTALSLGSTVAILAVHKLTMSNVIGEDHKPIRSSMALYLNAIFGLSELLCAVLADHGVFGAWMWIKIIAGIAGLLLLL